MEISLHRSVFAVFSCFLLMGGEVQGDCTEDGVEIEGGHYTLTKQLRSGSMLIYHCPEGLYPYPAMIRQCHLSGKWVPAPKSFLPQRCRLVECPEPNVLEHGTASPPQEKYFVDNETTYECYTGYKMRGSSRRVCLSNGKWSGHTPICSRDTTGTCADPGVPPGALKTGSVYDFNDVVQYHCKSNLFLVGSKKRVCQENGQWTGQEPACYYKHTYDTPLEVSRAFGGAITETLTTLDTSDDTREKKIRISKNGTLNIYIAVDVSESIEKEQFEEARDAVSKLITKISSFSVTPNYEIVFFASQVFEVVSILDFIENAVELSAVKKKLDDFRIEEGRNTGTDLSNVFNKFIEKMAITKIRVGEDTFKEHRHVFLIFTDGGYNIGGSPAPSVTRIKNMVYMNHNNEDGINNRLEYLDIYIFAIGAQIFDDDLMPLTVGTGGPHYFRMKDIKNLQKTFDEIIDEEDVKGLCGLHKDYDTDNERERYPWYALIIVQSEGTAEIRKCFGSLVTRQFILTAAHCFRFEDRPDHVTVEINDGQGKVKRVKDFRLHPDYNVHARVKEGVKEFYDYDVALIQLEEDVQISTFVRPICIPCTQETSDALKLGTCKQQEQFLLANSYEKLNFLTRAGGGVREKDVYAKLGDVRKECIRHALEAPGITTDTPEVAVTENFLCTGGRSHHRDHIACTGDSGGAVFKTWQHRTIQVGTVSWGTKNLCSSGGLRESDDTSRDFHINLFKVVPFLKSVLGNDTQDIYEPLAFLSE